MSSQLIMDAGVLLALDEPLRELTPAERAEQAHQERRAAARLVAPSSKPGQAWRTAPWSPPSSVGWMS